MKTLLIVRHAKSSWNHPGLSDHDRPLNQRGKEDAPRMGEVLRDEDSIPDLIISSTAKRAQKTAELMAEASGFEGEIVMTRAFYHADSDTYLDMLKTIPDNIDTVMFVGHNPGMEELVYDLTGESVRFTTANIAQVRLPIGLWNEFEDEISGDLLNLWRPRDF